MSRCGAMSSAAPAYCDHGPSVSICEHRFSNLTESRRRTPNMSGIHRNATRAYNAIKATALPIRVCTCGRVGIDAYDATCHILKRPKSASRQTFVCYDSQIVFCFMRLSMYARLTCISSSHVVVSSVSSRTTPRTR